MNKRVLGTILVLFSTAALAQSNTGSVTLMGSIGNSVALSNPQFTGVPGTLTDNTVATAFNLVYDFGDINLIPIAALDANGFARLNFTFDMRSNIGYRLAAVSVDNLAPSSLAPAQFGFSVKSIAECPLPTQVFNSGARTDAAVAPFDSTAGVNGVYDIPTDTVTYTSTLADAAVEANIVTGPRISARGSLNSPNNYIIVGTEFVFRPELFLGAGNFSHTVTFTAYAVP